MGHFTYKQWTILAILYVSIVCVFIPVGLMQPFYPVLAMSKGATPVEFGLVFGVFRLTMCLGSPLLGKFIKNTGPRFMFAAGVMLVGGCCILMGVINYIADILVFLGESYAVQAVAGLGTVMTAISATTIVTKEFPEDMGAVFGGTEIAVGLAQVLGSLMGGILLEYQGFTMPFVLFGSIILLISVMDIFLLPEQSDKTVVTPEGSNQVTIISVLRLPCIIIFITALVSVCLAFGFFIVTYEIHLEPLNLTTFQVSAMFALNSVMFCISSWFAGWVSDKFLSPLTVSLGGAVLTLISFLLLGPAPFLPILRSLPLEVIANILFGIGNGTQVVATFTGMGRGIVTSGLPNNLATHGLVCGIWNCCFSLGCFIGFTLGGWLLQIMGYQWACVLLVGMEFLVVTNLCFFWYSRSYHSRERTCSETKELIQSPAQRSTQAINIEQTFTHSISMGYGITYGSYQTFSIK
ncbi:unnamed protein product [Meganyctiphanes norvegica]|uniref:Major facilitator superfamily (MFS) profile domain-containing protein n=1 Tax=Meganyctiphanes norvegica TaxID=48144 RepID=A0AAV2RMJ9_MEGNR